MSRQQIVFDSDSDAEDDEEDEMHNEKKFHPRRVRLTNLDKRTTTELIRRELGIFGGIGHVSNVCDDQYRKGRCLSFVTFVSSRSCNAALSHNGDIIIHGRKILIERAYELTRVYLEHLPRQIKANEIRAAFSSYDVDEVRVIGDKDRFAIVDFGNEDERNRALGNRFVKLGTRNVRISSRKPIWNADGGRKHSNNTRH